MLNVTTSCNVFISSTCYDLADLRRELRRHLEGNGFLPSLSEDPYSAFYVDPSDDSIGSCLTSIERSDVVVCIIDRRYGPNLSKGAYVGHSATEAEIRHAWDCEKPVFFFIRKVAWDEFQQLQSNPEYPTRWVEPGDAGRRQQWLAFVTEVCKHDPSKKRSNWRDLFDYSCDLCPLVLKRLLDYFPNQSGVVAMRPERVVRLHFVLGHATQAGNVYGHFRNIGIGPALNILHGVRVGSVDKSVHSRGGLGEKENISAPDGGEFFYEIPDSDVSPPVLFCEYDNRFGDRYRVEVPLFKTQKGHEPSGGEKFFAVSTGTLLTKGTEP